MNTIKFELVTPEKPYFSDAAEMVLIPGLEGDFGVLPGHAPIISSLRPGVVEVLLPGAVKKSFIVSGGIAEVAGGERCTVLATECAELNLETREAVEENLNRASSREEKEAAAVKLAQDKNCTVKA